MRLIDADHLKKFIEERSYPVRYDRNSVEQGMTLTGISECIDKQFVYDAKIISRGFFLLREATELLEKQCKSPITLNLLDETVFYDGADCDGWTLKEDIESVLFDAYEEQNKGIHFYFDSKRGKRE